MEQKYKPIIVLPEIMEPIETLKHPQLHITLNLEETATLVEALKVLDEDYKEVINKFVRDNKFKKLLFDFKNPYSINDRDFIFGRTICIIIKGEK